MEKDPLAKWRKAGYQPAELEEVGSVTAVAPFGGIKPREYKAFVSDSSRLPMLLIKRGTVKQPKTDLTLPYGYLTKIISDGYGQVVSFTFVLPMSSSPTVVLFEGEGMEAMIDGIRRGAVSSVQIFDPDRHLPTPEGDFDIEAYEWRGPCVIKHISVTAKDSPAENTTKH